MHMTGAQAVIACLKREKVPVVFGYPGGAVLDLYDALYQAKFPHILTGHEQGAVHAADGYARVTGKPGVCFATSGPGICNMVTGLATANSDSVPLVVISGQVPTHLLGKDSFQEADVTSITRAICKRNYLVRNADDLPRVLREAFTLAVSGRPGPVCIDIAKNVFQATLDFTYPDEPAANTVEKGDENSIREAVRLLREAKKPLLMVGGGVVISDTADALRGFVTQAQLPVVTTLMGKGAIDDGYATNLGLVGMHGSFAANRAVMQCDLLLAVGCRFSDRVAGNVKAFAPHAKIVHFDIDPRELGKIIEPDLKVKGDLRWSLPAFAAAARQDLPADYAGARQDWRQQLEEAHRTHPFACRHLDGQISPQDVITEVQQYAREDTIVATDVGQHQIWAAQFWQSSLPRHFVTSGGLGTMGYGLPAALGAKVGQKAKQVVLFTGDGSIMMNCQEFATLHKYGLTVKTVVLHNSVLGMVNQWQRMFYHGHSAESLLHDGPDLTRVAASMGVTARAVHQPGELAAAVKELMQSDGPALLDVFIPEDENVYPMVPGGKRLDEMVLGD